MKKTSVNMIDSIINYKCVNSVKMTRPADISLGGQINAK